MTPPTASLDAFWETFVRNYWQKEAKVFPDFVGASFFDPKEVLAIWHKMASGKQDEIGYRAYVGDRQTSITEPAFAPYGDTLEEYIEHVYEKLGRQEFVVVISYPEKSYPTLQTRAYDLFQGLFSRVGLPAKNFNITMFLGKYTTSPFGIHADPGNETFSLCLAGNKRMAFWNNEDWVESTSPEIIRREVERAQVLEMRAGDLLYWPDQPHIGVSESPALQATFNFDFWCDMDMVEHISRTLTELMESELGNETVLSGLWRPEEGVPKTFFDVVELAERLCASGKLRKALEEDWATRGRALRT